MPYNSFGNWYDAGGAGGAGGSISVSSPALMAGAALNQDAAAQQAAARAQDQQRYADILSIYQGNQQLGDYWGQQRVQDTKNQFDALSNQQQQNFMDRGLGNSSLAFGAQSATARNKAGALNDLQDQLAMQQIGLRTQTAQFMERPNTTFPDLGMIANLNQGIGAGGAAGWYGGGGQSQNINPLSVGAQNQGANSGVVGGYFGGGLQGGGMQYGSTGLPSAPRIYSGARPATTSGGSWWSRLANAFFG